MPRIPLNSVPSVIRGCEVRADCASGCRSFFQFFEPRAVSSGALNPPDNRFVTVKYPSIPSLLFAPRDGILHDIRV